MGEGGWGGGQARKQFWTINTLGPDKNLSSYHIYIGNFAHNSILLNVQEGQKTD